MICTKLIVPPVSQCKPSHGGINKIRLVSAQNAIDLETIPESSNVVVNGTYDPSTRVELYTVTLKVKVVYHNDDYEAFLESLRRVPLSAYVEYNDDTYEHLAYTSQAQALYLTAYDCDSSLKIEDGHIPEFTFTQRTNTPPKRVSAFPKTYSLTWVKALPYFDKVEIVDDTNATYLVTPDMVSVEIVGSIVGFVSKNRSMAYFMSGDTIAFDYTDSNYKEYTISLINPPTNLIMKCVTAYDQTSSGLIDISTPTIIAESTLPTKDDFEVLQPTPAPEFTLNASSARLKFVF